jgi:malonate-semialdehyde dehydrogenase (acetylating)/methylmalonate-semialdehyde dehydrogenase
MTSEIKTMLIGNYINGQKSAGNGKTLSVIAPQTGRTIAEVILSSQTDLETAVNAAKKSFPLWSGQTLKSRVQVFFKFRNLLEQHIDELTDLICQENGKIASEARAEILKGMELCEFTCSLPQIVADEVQQVSLGVECRTSHAPLGVVASIAPFNFPLMVPLWTIPNALALGNTMIFKPSEKVPLSVLRMAELLEEAGLPKGVFNVVNGDKAIVEAICDHPDIAAVSFVGSTKIAKIVYQRATNNLKRCMAMGGAKNHMIVLPDAHPQMAGSDIAASMAGCAGQRCMAASAMIAIGDSDHIVAQLCHYAKQIIPGENLGAIISKEAKERIENYINEAEKEGAKILVDGRNTVVRGKENGFYVGPTVIDYVRPDMAIAKEEVFGPVMAIMRVKEVDEAIKIENSSKYGNAASVFTQSGKAAHYITERVSAGMTGVNIGVPVPREPFSFGGWNESKFGVTDITGKSSIHFWTKIKKTTVKWNPEHKVDWMS